MIARKSDGLWDEVDGEEARFSEHIPRWYCACMSLLIFFTCLMSKYIGLQLTCYYHHLAARKIEGCVPHWEHCAPSSFACILSGSSTYIQRDTKRIVRKNNFQCSSVNISSTKMCKSRMQWWWNKVNKRSYDWTFELYLQNYKSVVLGLNSFLTTAVCTAQI